MTAALALYLMLFPQPPQARPKAAVSTEQRRYPQFPNWKQCLHVRSLASTRIDELQMERSYGPGYVRSEQIIDAVADLNRFADFVRDVEILNWEKSDPKDLDIAKRAVIAAMGEEGFRRGFRFGD